MNESSFMISCFAFFLLFPLNWIFLQFALAEMIAWSSAISVALFSGSLKKLFLLVFSITIFFIEMSEIITAFL